MLVPVFRCFLTFKLLIFQLHRQNKLFIRDKHSRLTQASTTARLPNPRPEYTQMQKFTPTVYHRIIVRFLVIASLNASAIFLSLISSVVNLQSTVNINRLIS